MQLINKHTNKDYAEEDQSLVVKFAVCKPVGNDYETIHNFVNCRDFLSDVIFWHQNEMYGRSIYRFSIESKDLKTIHPILAIESNHTNKLLSNLHQLDGVVSVHNITKNTTIIEFNPIWFASSVNISLLSLTLKVLSYKENTTFPELVKQILDSDHKERKYINKITSEAYIKLITEGLKVLSTEPLVMEEHEKFLSWSNGDIHAFLGIVSIFSKESPKSNLMRFYQKEKQKKVAREGNKPKNPNPCSSLHIANNLV
jgi:hypothetical protein